MNGLIKSSCLLSSWLLLNKQQIQSSSCLSYYVQTALFHSTSVLERGRRVNWSSRYKNNNYRRSRKNPFKQQLLRNINAYAERILFDWQSGFDPDEGQSNKGPSWFKPTNNGSQNKQNHGQGRHSKGRGKFSFCADDDDDDDVESVFRAAFGDRFFFSSFVDEDYSNWSGSSRNFNRHRRSSRQSRRHKQHNEYEDEDEDEHEYEREHDYASENRYPKSNLAPERKALGLTASGPLKLVDVKNAYRACALKWHPDRHQGSSKVAAEERFKTCTAAYQTLCDKLAVN